MLQLKLHYLVYTFASKQLAPTLSLDGCSAYVKVLFGHYSFSQNLLAMALNEKQVSFIQLQTFKILLPLKNSVNTLLLFPKNNKEQNSAWRSTSRSICKHRILLTIKPAMNA
jgi:hypothetical protein